MSKKYTDQRNMEANKRIKCYKRMKINPKAFAIPILTAFVDYSQNRDRKCFRVYFHSLITLDSFIC